MCSDIAIKVENLSKFYPIYKHPSDRLKELFLPKFLNKSKNYFREFWALKEISFEIKKGETIGVIGRNGSGKSTLLQLICGTLHQTSGSIQTQGRIAALLELGSGFNPEFTGIENIYLNAAIIGLTKNEVDNRLDNIISFSDIGEFIHQPVKTYSSGMYVRLAFSVAINVSPDILIVDEALAVGDPAFQLKCMKKFEEFRQKGTTIILVSHDLGSILQFSSRCILLDAGKKLDVETPKQAVDTFRKILVNQQSSHDSKHYLGKMATLKTRNWAKHFSLNAGCEIYGNKKAEITDFGIFERNGNISSQKIYFGETYIFKMQVTFHEQALDPIFTLTIRDLTGKEIAGTNTLNEKIVTGNFLKGNKVEVSFQFSTKLSPGNYLLTFACSGYESDQFIVYERLYHILILEVIGSKPVVGHFDLDAIINIQNLNT